MGQLAAVGAIGNLTTDCAFVLRMFRAINCSCRGGEKCSLPRLLQMSGRSELCLSEAMAEKLPTQGHLRSTMLQFRSAHFRPALSTAQLRSHSSVYTEPVTRGCRTGGATRAQAGKGFGKSQEAQVTGARR